MDALITSNELDCA